MPLSVVTMARKGQILKNAQLSIYNGNINVINTYLTSYPDCCGVVIIHSVNNHDSYDKIKKCKTKKAIIKTLYPYLRNMLGYTFAILADNNLKNPDFLRVKDIFLSDKAGGVNSDKKLNIKSNRKISVCVVDLTKFTEETL